VCAREELRVELVDFLFFFSFAPLFFRLPRGAVRLVVGAWQELRTELVDADAARSFFTLYFVYITFLFVHIFSCSLKVCIRLSTYISMYLWEVRAELVDVDAAENLRMRRAVWEWRLGQCSEAF